MRSLIFLLLLSFNATAALSIRDLDGDWSNGHEGVYDDVLDITWLADANLSSSNNYGHSFTQFGSHWNVANNFIDSLNSISYLGHDSWRLPGGSCQGSGCGENIGYISDELLFHHYQNFESLENSHMINGLNILNISLFSNVQSHYWTSTKHGYVSPIRYSWGGQNLVYINGPSHTWPVHDGDIGLAPVPLPAGIYLFLSGLVGLGLLRGRNG